MRKKRDLIQRKRDGGSIAAAEEVVLGPQNVRAFDTETGFQSGHLLPYREGDWKRLLGTEQKSRPEPLMGTCAAPVRWAGERGMQR